MDVQKQLKVPFVIYADFESYLVKCDQQPLNPSISFTQKTQEHKPSGFCYTVVSEVENYDTPPIVYRGRRCSRHIFRPFITLDEKTDLPL